MKTIRAFVLVAAMFASACASTPGAPSGASDGLLSGSWTGTLTVTRTGQQPIISGTTWSFVLVPNTGATTYTATIASNATGILAPLITDATAVVTMPDTFSTQGTFSTNPGCVVSFGAFGTVRLHTLTANLVGTDCQYRTFDGSIVLSR